MRVLNALSGFDCPHVVQTAVLCVGVAFCCIGSCSCVDTGELVSGAYCARVGVVAVVVFASCALAPGSGADMQCLHTALSRQNARSGLDCPHTVQRRNVSPIIVAGAGAVRGASVVLVLMAVSLFPFAYASV